MCSNGNLCSTCTYKVIFSKFNYYLSKLNLHAKKTTKKCLFRSILKLQRPNRKCFPIFLIMSFMLDICAILHTPFVLFFLTNSIITFMLQTKIVIFRILNLVTIVHVEYLNILSAKQRIRTERIHSTVCHRKKLVELTALPFGYIKFSSSV